METIDSSKKEKPDYDKLLHPWQPLPFKEKQKPTLFIVDCDGVLYPREQLPTEKIVAAVEKVFDKYQIPAEIRQECSQKARESKYNGLYQYTSFVARQVGIPFDILAKEIVAHTDYSHIQPNPDLLKKLRYLNRRHEVCIYTNNTKQHTLAVCEKLFGKNPETVGIPIYHIGTIQRQGLLCPKQSKEALWLLWKIYAKEFKEMCFLDDTPAILNAVQKAGCRGQLITKEAPLLGFVSDVIEKSKYMKPIKRHELTPFDKQVQQSLFRQHGLV